MGISEGATLAPFAAVQCDDIAGLEDFTLVIDYQMQLESEEPSHRTSSTLGKPCLLYTSRCV